MTSAFESIAQGLSEAIDYNQGRKEGAQVHHFSALDIKAIRAQVDMSQSQFAKTFGISLGTLRHWEQGDRTPKGAARVLLTVLEKNPSAVIQALNG